MKKFMLFAFDYFYPNGGMHDYIDIFYDEETCHVIGQQLESDCYQIMDITDGSFKTYDCEGVEADTHHPLTISYKEEYEEIKDRLDGK